MKLDDFYKLMGELETVANSYKLKKLKRRHAMKRKTIYKCEIQIPNNEVYYYGDKFLRISSVIINTLELILIIYLLAR